MIKQIFVIAFFAFSIKAHSFDFDVLSDSIESRQVAYALEKGDSILMYDIKNYNFNKLRKCSGLLKKLRRRNACCCTETKNDTINEANGGIKKEVSTPAVGKYIV